MSCNWDKKRTKISTRNILEETSLLVKRGRFFCQDLRLVLVCSPAFFRPASMRLEESAEKADKNVRSLEIDKSYCPCYDLTSFRGICDDQEVHPARNGGRLVRREQIPEMAGRRAGRL